MGVQELWVKGFAWIQAPQKDFIQGLNIFSKIVALKVATLLSGAIFSYPLVEQPDDYWATVLTGGCLTWSGRAKEGEPYLRKATQLDPNMPHGYSGTRTKLKSSLIRSTRTGSEPADARQASGYTAGGGGHVQQDIPHRSGRRGRPYGKNHRGTQLCEGGLWTGQGIGQVRCGRQGQVPRPCKQTELSLIATLRIIS